MRFEAGRILTFLMLVSGTACKVAKVAAPDPSELNRPENQPLKEEPDTILNSTDTPAVIQPQEEVQLKTYKTLPDTISLIAVGDIMTGTNFPDPSYLPADNARWLWKDVTHYLRSADITFGNLEGVILDEGGEQKECKNPEVCYLFRMPEVLAFRFQEAGFDLMSLANNHANDFGVTGRINTQRVLDALQIGYAGSSEKHQTGITQKRVRVGMMAVAPNRGTLNLHNEELVLSCLDSLSEQNDMVIVSFHGGAEGAKNMHVTGKREFYFGEDRGNVYEFAHKMIDHGADVLIGHGPHVPRAIEVYKERLILYSLGNFLTYGRFNLRGAAGEAPLVSVKLDPTGRFLSGQIHAFYQHYSLGPRLDKSKRAIKTIKRLSEDDFPENPIRIDDTGKISYLPN